MSQLPRIAYDIQVIHDCIVKDTEVYQSFNKASKLSLYQEKKQLLEKHPDLSQMINTSYVHSLDPERGKLVERVAWIPAKLIIVDERIRSMCQNLFLLPREYAEKTGVNFGPCPGFGNLSACPPYSLTSKEVKSKLDSADIFIALQSKNFIEPPGIPAWQDILVNKLKKEIEKVKGKDSVTIAFGAGPCRLCYPKSCLGNGRCRIPTRRVFSLESTGVAVAQLCKDIAMLTGESDWKIKFIKYFATPKQTQKEWKLTFGVAVKIS